MYLDIVPNRNSRPAILIREAWREGKKIRKRTVAPAKPTQQAKAKKQKRAASDGLPLHSFQTLISEPGGISRNRSRFASGKTLPPFHQVTEKTPLQAKAFDLLGL